MFQSLSVEQLQTCLQMAIQQLINSNTTATSDPDVVPQQQPQQQEIEQLTAADIHQTVTNLSTEQMQQLMQLQQQQASLSVLNQPNVSELLSVHGCVSNKIYAPTTLSIRLESTSECKGGHRCSNWRNLILGST